MKKWFDRLRDAIDRAGITPSELARRAGLPPTVVYKYLDGKVENPRADKLRRLARAVGVSEAVLRYGDVPVKTEPLRQLPLLSLASLATLGRGEDAITRWDQVSTVPVPRVQVGARAFAITIEDNSCAPEFSPERGSIVVVDPDVTPEPGSWVVAVVKSARAAIFRRLRPLGVSQEKGFRLSPTNPDYAAVDAPADTDDVFVLGRAVLHINRL